MAAAVAAAVFVGDQLSKWWAYTTLADGPMAVVDGVVRFKLTFNTGVSFSMFSGFGPIIAFVAFAIVGLILYVLRDAHRPIEAVALGLILGGALGNLADRIFRGDGYLDGAVVDFIDFSFFATFNVADMAINAGVIVMLLAVFGKRS